MFSLKIPRLMCLNARSCKSWSKAGPIASTLKSSREDVKQVKRGGISQTAHKVSSASKAIQNNIMNDPRVDESNRRFRNELVQFKSDLKWRLNVDQYQKKKENEEMKKEKPKNETKSKACLKSLVASQSPIGRRKEKNVKSVKKAEPCEEEKISSDCSSQIYKRKTIEEYDHERHNAFVVQKPAASAIALLLSAGAANATEFLPRGAYGARRHLDCQAYGLPRFSIDGDFDSEVD